MKGTRLHCLSRDAGACRPFRTGVSLHSHTMYSRESMNFIPRYTTRIPMVASELHRQEQRYQRRTGKRFDYSRGYWTPPLPAREAWELERSQIEDTLDLKALVSLTDHDNIEAAAQLQLADDTRHAPTSVEWTVPIGPTYLHLGLHNLSASVAPEIMAELARYTATPSTRFRSDLLNWLHSQPEVLIVLNHPLWDQAEIGAGAHAEVLTAFLEEAGDRIHALELNGLRPWSENRATVDWAGVSGHPLISGGDRHGCEPNSIINVTNAETFAEFVSEVRSGGRSEVVFLPQYREPLKLRMLRGIHDMIRDYPQFTGREHWSNRVLFQRDSGEIVPISQVWKHQVPDIVRVFVSGIRIIQAPWIQRLLRSWPRCTDAELPTPALTETVSPARATG
jgi:hypothetical protein